MKKLLIVVDMVNGFVKEGALADKNIARIIPAIEGKIESAKMEGTQIIAFRDCHNKEDEEFKFYPPHCLKGTYESQLVDELKKYEDDMIIIDKNTTNGFNTQEMRKILKENVYDEIEITGCCSDICVRDLTQSLLKYISKNNLSTQIKISQNSIDTFGGKGHNADEVNKKMLEEFIGLGVEVELNNSRNVLKVKRVTDNKFLNLFQLTYMTQKGEIKYEMVSRRAIPELIEPKINPDAVSIIPYSYSNGKMLVHLIKEFRYPLNGYIYAVPAGLVEEGEKSIDSAKREVEEELGCEVLKIERTETSSYSSAGMTDERGELFEAEVKLNGKQNLGHSENIEVLSKPVDEVEKLLDEENFGVRSKLGLRSFILKQKIKELEKKLQSYEDKERGE